MRAPAETTEAATHRKQTALDQAAYLTREAMKEGKAAARLALRAETRESRIEAAKAADRAGTAALEASLLLVDAGAVVPEWQAQAEQSERGSLDLASLATLDTENARELLALLEKATACAEKLDAERNRVLPTNIPTGPSETRGVDFAESINELAQRLRGEIFGRGPGRE